MTEGYVEKSIAASDEDIEKINQYTRSPLDKDSAYIFSVVLCSNDIDRDYEKFSLKSLNQLKELFLGKTGIFDHSMKSADQKARIFDTWVEKAAGKKTADGEDLYFLKARAYMLKSDENMPLINEIEAGIKKEVSISCSVRSSICSICNTDKRKSRCEHIGGREYNGKGAYTVLDDALDAYEFSFVAVPAQRDAGVTKSFDFTEREFDMTDIIKSLKECEKDISLSRAQARGLADKLEQLDSEAELGREYKKALATEVVGLCAKAMPTMDLKIFANVAQVMTTSELLAFKKAFSKAQYDKSAGLQLKPERHSYSVEQFKI